MKETDALQACLVQPCVILLLLTISYTYVGPIHTSLRGN